LAATKTRWQHQKKGKQTNTELKLKLVLSEKRDFKNLARNKIKKNKTLDLEEFSSKT
jgi:hypothetical protein